MSIALYCIEPPVPLNSYQTYPLKKEAKYRVGTLVYFSCRSGFYMVGRNAMFTCTTSGWKNDDFRCICEYKLSSFLNILGMISKQVKVMSIRIWRSVNQGSECNNDSCDNIALLIDRSIFDTGNCPLICCVVHCKTLFTDYFHNQNLVINFFFEFLYLAD